MSLNDLIGKMKLRPRDAEVIFDRDEPVGAPTDLVMPRRRWFGRGDTIIEGTPRSTEPRIRRQNTATSSS